MFTLKFVNLIIIFTLQWTCNESLLFPQSSILQITMSLSMPVEIPNRKYYIDWGFQMNYDMPFNPASFYNVPIWPGFGSRSERSLDVAKYGGGSGDLHPSDLTAGEFYASIEDLLVSYGYHETCLLRSVCELARHPFDDDQNNLLAQIISFVLSPSTHEAFSDNEVTYRSTYEGAENKGFRGQDCHKLYPLCKQGFLDLITKIINDQS